MKNLRLLLLGLLTPLLFGSVFAFDLTRSDLNYINSVAYTSGSKSFNGNTNFVLYDHGSSWDGNTSICVLFHNYQYSVQTKFLIFGSDSSTTTTLETNNWRWITQPYALYCRGMHPTWRYLIYQNFDVGGSTSFDYYVVNAADIFNGKLGFDVAGITSQLSSCQSNLSTCQSDLSSANSNLNSCQSDLSSCQNNGSNCDTLYGVCQENLSGCMADKSSLDNYNEALSTQLNECLNNQGTGSNLSGLILNNNSLFWYLDDSLLSLPINNNLFLPLGYQGALDSGNVLYIKSIDEDEPENYYITPEDKVSIIDILSYIFVFFLGIGIIFSLIKLFKKLFTH